MTDATLAGLFGQTFREFDLIVADQTEDDAYFVAPELATIGAAFENRGMAEQRHFLLSQARASYVLYLDDDLLLEPEVVGRLYGAIREQGCGVLPSGVYHLELPTNVPNRKHNTDDPIKKYLGSTGVRC